MYSVVRLDVGNQKTARSVLGSEIFSDFVFSINIMCKLVKCFVYILLQLCVCVYIYCTVFIELMNIISMLLADNEYKTV